MNDDGNVWMEADGPDDPRVLERKRELLFDGLRRNATNDLTDMPARPPMNRNLRARAEVVINADVVKQRRKALGLSQVELALMAVTSPRVITAVEKGRAIDPATSVTLRLARALSVTVEALCAGAQPFSSRTASRIPGRLPTT